MGLKVVPIRQKLKRHKTYKLTLAFQHRGLFFPLSRQRMQDECELKPAIKWPQTPRF